MQVQSVVSHLNSNGTSQGRLILENGEQVTLPYRKTLWRKQDSGYERNFQSINHRWLAHRGASWRPVREEEPGPPLQG